MDANCFLSSSGDKGTGMEVIREPVCRHMTNPYLQNTRDSGTPLCPDEYRRIIPSFLYCFQIASGRREVFSDAWSETARDNSIGGVGPAGPVDHDDGDSDRRLVSFFFGSASKGFFVNLGRFR